MRITNAMVICMHQHSVAAKVKTRKYTHLPYWTHPCRVAMRIATHHEVKLFWISGALLHDTVEDTVYNPEEVYVLKYRIIAEVGEDALRLVEELTNEDHDKSIPRRQRKEMDWKRLKGVSRPAKIIKMLDRIDNLTDMVGAPADFKKLYCQESEELLKVVGDADEDIAHQLQCAIDFPYKLRKFSLAELEQKPKGLVFEHVKYGTGFIEEPGTGGHVRFMDGSLARFDGRSEWVSQVTDDDPFGSLMRETGESIKR